MRDYQAPFQSSDKRTHLLPSPAGESAPDRRGGLGEMVRPGLQHQGDGRGHQRGQLPLPGGSGGALQCPEAPPGPALLRILAPRLTQLVDVKTERYHSGPFFFY